MKVWVQRTRMASARAGSAPQVETQVFPHVNHIMVAYDSGVLAKILSWIRSES